MRLACHVFISLDLAQAHSLQCSLLQNSSTDHALAQTSRLTSSGARIAQQAVMLALLQSILMLSPGGFHLAFHPITADVTKNEKNLSPTLKGGNSLLLLTAILPLQV